MPMNKQIAISLACVVCALLICIGTAPVESVLPEPLMDRGFKIGGILNPFDKITAYLLMHVLFDDVSANMRSAREMLTNLIADGSREKKLITALEDFIALEDAATRCTDKAADELFKRNMDQMSKKDDRRIERVIKQLHQKHQENCAISEE